MLRSLSRAAGVRYRICVWRWIVAGGFLLSLVLISYGPRPRVRRATPALPLSPPSAPAEEDEPTELSEGPPAPVSPDRLAWDLYFARVAEERAAVAAQAFFPEMRSRLVEDLSSEDFDRTQGAIAAIRHLGGAEAAAFVPEIERALAEGRATGALYAAVEEIGEPARKLAPLLIARLHEQIEHAPRNVHADLIEHIDIGTPASALGALGSAEGVPALRAAMLEEIQFLPEDAVAAAARLGPLASAARPELFALLRRRFFELDEGVSAALAATDPDGDEILPALRAMASEPRAPRGGIAQVYRRLGAAEETERLAGWLDREDGRRDALDALASFGPRARAAIPAIERLLETWEDDERACVTLAAIAPERIPDLIARILARPPRLLVDGDLGVDEFQWHERPANLATLGRWGDRARGALARIVEHLANPEIHPNTLGAAAALDPTGESWTGIALSWLSGESWKRRSWAVRALGRTRPLKPQAREALLPLLRDTLLRDQVADLLAERGEVEADLVPSLLFEDPAALRALAKVAVIPREHLGALIPIAGKHPREGLQALARLDAGGMEALRAYVAACAPEDAPPSPAAIEGVLRKHGLTRDEARAVLSAGLPEERCAEALAWLE